jgi:hypothetical protein
MPQQRAIVQLAPEISDALFGELVWSGANTPLRPLQPTHSRLRCFSNCVVTTKAGTPYCPRLSIISCLWSKLDEEPFHALIQPV